MEEEIFAILIQRGNELFQAPRHLIDFTDNENANNLLNNLEEFPHAFVMGCLLNRLTKARTVVWNIPYLLSEELGGFTFEQLANMEEEAFINRISNLRIHLRLNIMANDSFEAIEIIENEYNGNANNIWNNNPSSALVVYRFLRFPGIKQKIATMATNILARNFKVPFSDHYSIDISVDRHVKRVFKRLKLVRDDADDLEIIYKARAKNPNYPGILDFSIWEIGSNWCFENNPSCEHCYLNQYCDYRNNIA